MFRQKTTKGGVLDISKTKKVFDDAQKSKNSKEFLGHESPMDSHKSSISDMSEDHSSNKGGFSASTNVPKTKEPTKKNNNNSKIDKGVKEKK